jgi:hypothetical protein
MGRSGQRMRGHVLPLDPEKLRFRALGRHDLRCRGSVVQQLSDDDSHCNISVIWQSASGPNRIFVASARESFVGLPRRQQIANVRARGIFHCSIDPLHWRSAARKTQQHRTREREAVVALVKRRTKNTMRLVMPALIAVTLRKSPNRC